MNAPVRVRPCPSTESTPSTPNPQTAYPTITVDQPCASWIAFLWKRIETRTHPRFAKLASPPQVIAVHASLTYSARAAKDAMPYLSESMLAAHRDALRYGQFPRGAVVALATAAWHHRFAPFARNEVSEIFFEQHHGVCRKALCEIAGLYGLGLDKIAPLDPPVSARGHQGIWYWTPPPDWTPPEGYR